MIMSRWRDTWKYTFSWK